MFLNSGGFQLSVLTNVDNVISGTGSIYSFNASSTGGSLINELKGVVDANVTGASLVLGGDHDSNAGLMEATEGGTLLFENMTIDNFLNHTKVQSKLVKAPSSVLRMQRSSGATSTSRANCS